MKELNKIMIIVIIMNNNDDNSVVWLGRLYTALRILVAFQMNVLLLFLASLLDGDVSYRSAILCDVEF